MSIDDSVKDALLSCTPVQMARGLELLVLQSLVRAKPGKSTCLGQVIGGLGRFGLERAEAGSRVERMDLGGKSAPIPRFPAHPSSSLS